jgi:hypothetical protein
MLLSNGDFPSALFCAVQHIYEAARLMAISKRATAIA